MNNQIQIQINKVPKNNNHNKKQNQQQDNF